MWASVVPSWARRQRPKPPPLVGAERVLDLADRMRRSGCVSPAQLHDACWEEARTGAIAHGDAPELYLHACRHAGIVAPLTGVWRACPVCGAEFDVGPDLAVV